MGLSHRTTNIHQEGWKAESLMYSPLLYDPILHMHICEMGHCPSYSEYYHYSKLAHVVILYIFLFSTPSFIDTYIYSIP